MEFNGRNRRPSAKCVTLSSWLPVGSQSVQRKMQMHVKGYCLMGGLLIGQKNGKCMLQYRSASTSYESSKLDDGGTVARAGGLDADPSGEGTAARWLWGANSVPAAQACATMAALPLVADPLCSTCSRRQWSESQEAQTGSPWLHCSMPV